MYEPVYEGNPTQILQRLRTTLGIQTAPLVSSSPLLVAYFWFHTALGSCPLALPILRLSWGEILVCEILT